MKRGDVVRNTGEYAALPVGTSLVCIDGGVRKILNHSHIVSDGWFPALVMVVGPVEPEWLARAARAAHSASKSTLAWAELKGFPTDDRRDVYTDMARAAVAAADKARGIVNSREEFDALPAGTAVVERDWSAPARFAIKHKNTIMTPAPSSYPCFVIEPRQ